MHKIWHVKSDDTEKIKSLAVDADISELTAKILFHRGITDAATADRFQTLVKLHNRHFVHVHNIARYGSRPFGRFSCRKRLTRNNLAVNFGDYDVTAERLTVYFAARDCN